MGTGAGTLNRKTDGYSKMPEGGDPKVKKRLTHSDKNVRDQAIKELGELGSAASAHIDDLTMALMDPDLAGVRKSAALALGKMGPQGAEALGSQLGNESKWVREICAWGLSKMGREAASQKGLLAQRCGDTESEVRREAAKAIGLIGPCISEDPEVRTRETALDQQACAGLAEQLGDDNDIAAMAAASALALMGPLGAQSLGAKLQDSRHRVRMYACIGLTALKGQAAPYAQALHLLIVDEEPKVRKVAIECLGQLAPVDVASFIHEIADHLHDMDPEVRAATVNSTKVLHPEIFIGADDASKLADPDPVVRRAGAYALSFMGQAATYHLEALAAHLDDPDKDVREGADMALKKLGALGFVWTGVPRAFNFYNNIDGSKFAGTKSWQDIVAVSEKDLLMAAAGQRGKEIAVTVGKDGKIFEVITVGGGLGVRTKPSEVMDGSAKAESVTAGTGQVGGGVPAPPPIFVGGNAQATTERINETIHLNMEVDEQGNPIAPKVQ